mgnify:CR=1 FL=1
MALFADIGAQIKLEREQIKRGLENLHSNTSKLEDKSYASASVYGVASIQELVPLVVRQINETDNRIHEGCNGVAFREIHQFLEPLDAESAAVLASKITFDKVFSTKPKANQIQLMHWV